MAVQVDNSAVQNFWVAILVSLILVVLIAVAAMLCLRYRMRLEHKRTEDERRADIAALKTFSPDTSNTPIS